jgi:subtilisin family serine protease
MRRIFALLLALPCALSVSAQRSMRDVSRGTFAPTAITGAQQQDEEQKTPQRQRNTLTPDGRDVLVPVNVDGTIIYVPRGKTIVAPNNPPPPQAERPVSMHHTVFTGGGVRFTRGREMPAGSRAWPREALGLNNIAPELNGAGVNIALLDSGVSPNYELNGKVDVYDMTGAGNPSDTFGHGTAIAGILVGGSGETKFKSVAPGARVKSYKITYEENGETKTSGAHIKQAVADILEYNKLRPANRIDIINLSYGLDGGPDKGVEDALSKAYQNGITIISGAGNDANAVRYPAAYGFVIAAGAINRQKQLFSYSNYGPQLDFMAPGEDIFALDNAGGYGWLEGGTSYSSAYISGLAALVIQAWQNKYNVKPSPQQVYAVLKKISAPLPSVPEGKQGLGLPDASKIPAAV